MKLPKHFYCKTWRMSFYFCIGWKPEEVNAYLKKYKKCEIVTRFGDGKTVELHDDDGVCQVILIWTRMKKGKNFYPVLAHEAVHAANYCLHPRGIKSEGNDEPQAYLVEAIIREALS